MKYSAKCLQVLYLFAGAERKADLGDCLVDRMAVVAKDTGLDCSVEVSNIDVLRDEVNADLLIEAKRL